jgi:hypothetical protein
MSGGWPVSPPAQQGFKPKLICSIGPGLAGLPKAAAHGVVVVRHGVLVYEQYFRGDDMRGYTPLGVVPHNAKTLHNIGSITKGVVALLIGIALDRGWLKDLDAPIFGFFPHYADLRTAGKGRITIRHLLSMTSGLDWPERAISINDRANVVWQGRDAADPYRFVLARPLKAEPGPCGITTAAVFGCSACSRASCPVGPSKNSRRRRFSSLSALGIGGGTGSRTATHRRQAGCGYARETWPSWANSCSTVACGRVVGSSRPIGSSR